MVKNKYPILKITLYCSAALSMLIALHLYNTFFLTKYHGISTGDIVLIITVGVVFWYAWETRQMRKEQSIPFISVNFEEYDIKLGTRRDRFLVRNGGKGTAMNVDFRASQSIEGKMPIFKRIEILPPGGEEELIIEEVHYDADKDIQKGPIARSDFLNHIRHCISFDKYIFELSYRDILGGIYPVQGSFEASIPGKWIFIRK